MLEVYWLNRNKILWLDSLRLFYNINFKVLNNLKKQ